MLLPVPAADPPSFGAFLETYQATGPWTPADGLGDGRIGAVARDRFGLEMID